MADDGRRPGDLELARQLGRRFGEEIRRPGPFDEFVPFILDQIVTRRLTRHPAERGRALSDTWPMAQIDFIEDLARARRLIRFTQRSDFRGMLVLRSIENDFGEPPLIDFLNPRARKYLLKREANTLDLPSTLRAIAERPGVEVRNSEDALIGFMTLFVDSLNAASFAASAGTTYVNYLVNSQNTGYQLEYYPQYNYSPVVFGSKLTTPVTENIKSGHYHFQGTDSSGTVHTDSRAYFAGKSNTSTVIKVF